MKLLIKPITSTSTALLLVRLFLGIIFFAHGAQKVLGWFGGYGLDGTLGFMQGMGIPTVLAYVAIFSEFLGGIAIILGVFSRVFALGLVINMLVAISLVHFANGFFLNGAKGFGYEYNLALIALSLVLVLLGSGEWSLDHAIFEREKSHAHLGHISAAH